MKEIVLTDQEAWDIVHASLPPGVTFDDATKRTVCMSVVQVVVGMQKMGYRIERPLRPIDAETGKKRLDA